MGSVAEVAVVGGGARAETIAFGGEMAGVAFCRII